MIMNPPNNPTRTEEIPTIEELPSAKNLFGKELPKLVHLFPSQNGENTYLQTLRVILNTICTAHQEKMRKNEKNFLRYILFASTR